MGTSVPVYTKQYTMYIILLIPVLIIYLPNSQGITCYSCDNTNVSNGTCALGERTLWCEHDSWCAKTWGNNVAVAWNCSTTGPVDDYEACTTEIRDPNTLDTQCFCSSNLCNYSVTLLYNGYVLLCCLMGVRTFNKLG